MRIKKFMAAFMMYLGFIILSGTIILSITGTASARDRLLLSNTPTIQATELQSPKRLTIVLFDTSQIDRYCYNPALLMAHANNFNIVYYPISKIIDTPEKDLPFEKCDCAFFILCPEFLKTMDSSPVCKKVLSVVRQFSRMPNKMTGLMFPPVKISHQNPMALLSPLFSQLAINANDPQKNRLMFEHLTNRFLQLPLEYRPLSYHTTLSPPRPGSSFNVEQLPNGSTMSLALLPIKQQPNDHEIRHLFPFGVYWFNKARNNHLIISSSSLLNFSGISENFKLCPMKFSTRKNIHSALNQTIWEIYQAIAKNVHGIPTKTILTTSRPQLPRSIQSIGQTTKHVRVQNPYKIAWMELANKDEKQQKKLVHFIISSGLSHLWISINPNIYYSPIGKRIKGKEAMLKSVKAFTKRLAYQSAKQNVIPPKILLGFEIANNLYKPHMPKQAACDLYGNIYKDIPRPLDRTFWDNEIKEPLHQFLNDWYAHKLSNGIKISGIVLDLEMYGRKTTGQFLSTMGFEPETIINFLKPPLAQTMEPSLFTQYLMDNHLYGDYFSFLENKSEKLGIELRHFFSEEIPNVEIACYAPNISIDWFYKGLYRGLSTIEKPLHLFTFNAEFRSHKPWLTQNGIHVDHAGVLMLSKLESKQDFLWLDHVLKHHDGVWLNRFSRMAEPYHDDWSTLEQTSLSMKERDQFAAYLQAGSTTNIQQFVPNNTTILEPLITNTTRLYLHRKTK